MHGIRKIKNINIEINLPASKSISNRLLILNRLINNQLPIQNLSTAADTEVLQSALNSEHFLYDLRGSGTAFRFFTAFLAATTRAACVVTGNERMLQRPVYQLVTALNQLGGKVDFLGKAGFPPLKISPSAMRGGRTDIDTSVSSQFVSALMLIAPVLPLGLQLRFKGEMVSQPYIEMTRKLLKEFSVVCNCQDDSIEIAPQTIVPVPYVVEGDWTAASYWYEFLAVAGKGTVYLPDLQENSIQGDRNVVEIFEKLGVKTVFLQSGIEICASGQHVDFLEFDFINNPDLVQTAALACCLKKIAFRFAGIKNLHLKETDRIAALIAECEKIGFILEFSKQENTLSWNKQVVDIQQDIKISPHGDHRMAMAFAAAMLCLPIEIENQEVVSKSYPNFWEDMNRLCD
jgi:3-phosphoshikimate 1-carboxyvinyltransferase